MANEYRLWPAIPAVRQFGDTGEYPHGKRQRAREAALWAIDPPEYFTEGLFVALEGMVSILSMK